MEDMELKANIHSIETAGALDGPGLRYVIFFQGCPLRCKFCHNPDTWSVTDHNIKTVDEILNDILKYKEFFTFSNGGVTVSGGEPLWHSKFVLELFKKLKQHGIHTAIDTCGYVDIDETIEELVEYTDLFLYDIKHLDNFTHIELTGRQNDKILEFLNYIDEKQKRIWIKVVLLPTYSTDSEYINKLIEFLKKFDNIEMVELLPYHEFGKAKWLNLGYKYVLDIQPPDEQTVKSIVNMFKENGFKVSRNK